MTDAEILVERLAAASKKVVFAESCTAGSASGLLASAPGASGVLWGSFVCYAIPAKVKMLGLNKGLIMRYGAVSRETACAMAAGALKQSGADFAVSITGLAGPDGDGSGVPVGTVWIGLASQAEGSSAKEFRYAGARNEVRERAAQEALRELLYLIGRV